MFCGVTISGFVLAPEYSPANTVVASVNTPPLANRGNEIVLICNEIGFSPIKEPTAFATLLIPDNNLLIPFIVPFTNPSMPPNIEFITLFMPDQIPFQIFFTTFPIVVQILFHTVLMLFKTVDILFLIFYDHIH